MAHLPFELPPIALRPENFGATGNGTTDDAAAIQRCIDAAGARGTVQFTPGKTYRLNSGLTIATDNQVILAHGAQFTVNFSGVGITIGDMTGVRRHVRWYGGRIMRISNDFTSGNIGLRLLNQAHSAFYDFKIFGFEKGLEVLGDGAGSQYNTIVPAEIGYCLHGIALIARNNGWANSNCFLGGGRIGYYSNQPDSTGGYAIYMDREDSSVHVLNHNVFNGLSLENAMTANKPAGAIRAKCQDCAFLHMRYELFDSPKINCDFSECEGNYFDGGTELLDPSVDFTLRTASPSTPTSQAIWIRNRNAILYSGGSNGSVDKLMTLRNAGDATDTLLSIVQSTGVERIGLRADGFIVQRNAGNWGNGMGPVFTGTATVSFGEIAAGASAVAEVTPSGLGGTGVNQSLGIAGDPVTVGASPYTAGIGYTAQVKTNFGAVEVRATNHTGSPITLDNITLKVKVEKFNIG